jgi:prevent-host-death family protein
VLQKCYARSMTEVAARDLRNHTAELLGRAAAGEEITITVRGRPVAALVRLDRPFRRPFSKAEIIEVLETSRADAGLRADLAELASGTTDDLGPIE